VWGGPPSHRPSRGHDGGGGGSSGACPSNIIKKEEDGEADGFYRYDGRYNLGLDLVHTNFIQTLLNIFEYETNFTVSLGWPNKFCSAGGSPPRRRMNIGMKKLCHRHVTKHDY
jgi:hypothetical protein